VYDDKVIVIIVKFSRIVQREMYNYALKSKHWMKQAAMAWHFLAKCDDQPCSTSLHTCDLVQKSWSTKYYAVKIDII